MPAVHSGSRLAPLFFAASNIAAAASMDAFAASEAAAAVSTETVPAGRSAPGFSKESPPGFITPASGFGKASAPRFTGPFPGFGEASAPRLTGPAPGFGEASAPRFTGLPSGEAWFSEITAARRLITVPHQAHRILSFSECDSLGPPQAGQKNFIAISFPDRLSPTGYF